MGKGKNVALVALVGLTVVVGAAAPFAYRPLFAGVGEAQGASGVGEVQAGLSAQFGSAASAGHVPWRGVPTYGFARA